MVEAQATIEQLSPHIGAEVKGIDLAADISDANAGVIWDALSRHKVLFFRGQSRLWESDDDFASRLGWMTASKRPTSISGTKYKARSRTLEYSNSTEAALRTNHYHTDATFLEIPFCGLMLRPIVLPPCGGDTIWANTAAAYRDMPAHLRSFIDQLSAVHSNRWGYAELASDLEGLPLLKKDSDFGDSPFYGMAFETIHPLVCINPRTSERVILAGTHLRYIMGLTASGSADLHRMLQEYLHRPEYAVRWRWAEGDFAVWDNISTQHYGVRDYAGERKMQSVSLRGDVPLTGVDGKRSIPRVGDMAQIPEKGRISAVKRA